MLDERAGSLAGPHSQQQAAAAVKSAAQLTPHAIKEAALLVDGAPADPVAARPWYEQQERHAQHDEPAGGASTSGPLTAATTAAAVANKPRERVKFAAGSSEGGTEPDAAAILQQLGQEDGTPVVVSRTGFFSFTRPKHSNVADVGATSASHGQQPGEASLTGSIKQALGFGGGVSRANSHTASGQHHHVGFDSSAGNKSQAASEAGGSRAQSEAPSRSHSIAVAPSGMSATLKGLFGGASSKLFGSIMGRGSGSHRSDEGDEEEEELWFTSLDDFKPICHMLHRGRYMMAYFACANKTGQHFLLKKFVKDKMLPAEERGVRRAIAFSELLKHPNLVRMMGTWETDDTIFVVEEYVGKGDILNDCISHPDKYTERHVAVALAKPLLQALAHLHANNVIHRSVLPENAYMGIDDVLRLGHLNLAVDQSSDRPSSRTALLDYMAPEMLSVRPHNEHELALLQDDDDDDGVDEAEVEVEGGRSPAHKQQQQQQWALLQEQELQEDMQQQELQGDMQQVPRMQLGVLGQGAPESPLAAAIRAQAQEVMQQQQQQQQQQHSKWMQQPAQLEASRQGSLEAAALEQQLGEGMQPGDQQLHAAAVAAHSSRPAQRGQLSCGPLLRQLGGGAGGRAPWEYQDHYDEKVDVWQLGCMLHELLCGSMPFELDSKLESAGLSLWADIEVLPGSVPPDCADFIQQALTKNPQLRPSAQQLLAHPWLARCQAGDPWRDPIELEAARREAELATITGWLHYHWAATTAALSAVLKHWQRGSRIGPDQQQQQQQFTGDSDQQQQQQQPAQTAPSAAERARSRGLSSTGYVVTAAAVPPVAGSMQH